LEEEESMRIGSWLAIVVLSSLAVTGSLHSQQYPRAPMPPRDQAVSPFFEGWFANPDGTYTLSFGYFNRNREQVVEIPRGPDNYIEPAVFDGDQPTSFPPFNYGGLSGRRERGVFTITVPADFRGKEVAWTLRNRGEVHTVKGSLNSPAYELGDGPMAMGSIPPTVRLESTGQGHRGPAGPTAPVRSARVDEPVELSLWVEDESKRSAGWAVNANRREGTNDVLNFAWFKHSGPIGSNVAFSEERGGVDDPRGRLATTVTFSEAGDYVVRVRADNFGAVDSMPGDQCCWTNAYFPVTVTK